MTFRCGLKRFRVERVGATEMIEWEIGRVGGGYFVLCIDIFNAYIIGMNHDGGKTVTQRDSSNGLTEIVIYKETIFIVRIVRRVKLLLKDLECAISWQAALWFLALEFLPTLVIFAHFNIFKFKESASQSRRGYEEKIRQELQ